MAHTYRLPVPFFANLIWQESSFNPRDVSRAGALGIAQFMPKTAIGYGLINPFELIIGGCHIPPWASGVGAVIAAGLSWMLCREARGTSGP